MVEAVVGGVVAKDGMNVAEDETDDETAQVVVVVVSRVAPSGRVSEVAHVDCCGAPRVRPGSARFVSSSVGSFA